MPDEELAEAVELQRESICAQIIEQSGFQGPDHSVDDVRSLLLGWQRQSMLNPNRQFVSTS